VARLDRGATVVTNTFGDLSLLGPQVLAEPFLTPANRISGVRRHRRRLEHSGRRLERI
jgi:hypothetical protein